jgi:hypothetical protein
MLLILNRISKIPILHFEILTIKGGVFLDFWPIYVRINGINRRMRPKNQKVIVWGVGVQVLVVRGTIRKKGGSLKVNIYFFLILFTSFPSPSLTHTWPWIVCFHSFVFVSSTHALLFHFFN